MANKKYKYLNWFLFLSGLLLVVGSLHHIFFSDPAISFFDFEGFSFTWIANLILGVVLLVTNLGNILKPDFETVNFKSTTFIGFFAVALFIGSILLLRNDLRETYKYSLPLNKIETVEIEGTLNSNTSLKLREVEGRQSASIFMHGGLKEFPNINFSYNLSKLKNEITNIVHNDSEGMKKANDRKKAKVRNYNPQVVSMQTLPAGTKVKLKVRPIAHNNLQNYMEAGEHLKDMPMGEYDSRRTIGFYEISVEDEVLLRKFGLK